MDKFIEININENDCTIEDCKYEDFEKREIEKKLREIDAELESFSVKKQIIKCDIDALTSNADRWDIIFSAFSGIITGLMDVVFIKEFSFDKLSALGEEKVNKFVIKVADLLGAKAKDLKGAVLWLEKQFPIPADKVTAIFGGGLQHHLRDFTHHPTVIGLIFSILSQFTGKAYGTDTAGNFIAVDITDAGELIGKTIPEKLFKGTVDWFFHMVSDIAGSSSKLAMGNTGTGLPGFVVSFLKEMAALPLFKKLDKNGYKALSVWVSKLFNGTLSVNGKKIGRFDLRKEIGLTEFFIKMSGPVLINEITVRGFYFIRRFAYEVSSKGIKDVKQLDKIDINNVLPQNNRTIDKMLAVSSATFTAVDCAGALTVPETFFFSINYVGVVRCAFAVGKDFIAEANKIYLTAEHEKIVDEMIAAYNVKIGYSMYRAAYAISDAYAEQMKVNAECEEREEDYNNTQSEIASLMDKLK